jgi:hypothetical protein
MLKLAGGSGRLPRFSAGVWLILGLAFGLASLEIA